MTDALNRAELQLQIENVSSLAINRLEVHFTDTHTSATIDRLQDHDVRLSAGEAYELDYDVRQQPVLHWSRDAAPVHLAPGEQMVLYIACYGKFGW